MKILKRPALYMVISLASGILLSYFLIILNFYFMLKIILSAQLILILFYAIFKLKFNKSSIYIFAVIVFFFIGSFSYAYQEYRYYSNLSIINYSSENHIQVKGQILKDIGDLESNNYYLKAYYLGEDKVKYGKILLNSEKFKRFKNGDLIVLDLKLSIPEKNLNPGGFSYFKYLKNKGIYLQGWQPENVILIKRKRGFKNIIIAVKKRLLKTINTLFTKNNAAFIKAILLGEKENLSYQQEKLLREAGASHLLAISGLHVGIIILSFSFVLFKFFPDKKVALYFLTFLTIIYVIMVGAAVSIIRASLLALLFLWADEFNREGDFLNIIAFTLLINLIIDPLALFTVSLQLSYILVTSLFYITPLLNKFMPAVLAVSLAAQLAALALTAYYFNEYSYIAFITNLWVIPAISILLPFIFLIVLLSLININTFLAFVIVVEFLLQYLFEGLEIMVLIQQRPLVIAKPPLLIIILYYLTLFLLPYLYQKRIIYIKARKYFFWQKADLIIFFFILIALFINLESDLLEINFIAVGQGDGIFIKFSDGTKLLLDTGPPGRDGRNIEYNIISFLNNYGIKKIDYLMLSHFDADHVGGIAHLFDRKEIGKIMLPPFKEKSSYHQVIEENINKNRNINLIYLKEGMILEISSCQLFILNPPKNKIYDDRNENSIVFLLQHQQKKFLFTGDLSKKGEKRIIKEHQLPEVDVLKAGHHGSNTSSAAELIDSIKPKLAVISVGKNNFGHPAAEVLARFEARSINYLRTDYNGAVKIISNGEKIAVKTFK